MEAYNGLLMNGGAVLIFLGFAWSSIISIILIYRAFRENIFWGLACLLLPLALLFFILRFWRDTKRLVYWDCVALGIAFLGVGMLWLAPEFRTKIKEFNEQRSAKMGELQEWSESTSGSGKGRPSKAIRQMQAEYEKQERERAKVMEHRRRATELYGFVQTWREELMTRKPGETASEEEKERFRVEHQNYTGLLEEYKRAAEQVKKMETEFLNPAVTKEAATATNEAAPPPAAVPPAEAEATPEAQPVSTQPPQP